jgi:hypothetical protein
MITNLEGRIAAEAHSSSFRSILYFCPDRFKRTKKRMRNTRTGAVAGTD